MKFIKGLSRHESNADNSFVSNVILKDIRIHEGSLAPAQSYRTAHDAARAGLDRSGAQDAGAAQSFGNVVRRRATATVQSVQDTFGLKRSARGGMSGAKSGHGTRECISVIGLRGIPDVPGGIETHCENIYERLAKSRPEYKFVIFGRSPYIGEKRFHTRSGVEVVPVPVFQNKYLETVSSTFLSLLRARFMEGSKVVHIHAIGPGLFTPLARLLGMTVVLTHHGEDYNRAKWNVFAKTILRLGERLGMSSANEVIAVSDALKARLEIDYPSHQETLNYIPNGADHILEEEASNDPQVMLDKFGLTPGQYIVSVGRLVPEKGFMDLIRAHRKSKLKLPLVIIGGNGQSAHDQELFDEAHDSVIFTGALGRQDVKTLVGNAGLFVLPSHHEGLPIVALEASLLATPVLLSDISANKAIELEPSRYYPVGDTDALAERLKTDAMHLEPSVLSAEFLWDNIADKTWSVYRKLLDRQGVKSGT